MTAYAAHTTSSNTRLLTAKQETKQNKRHTKEPTLMEVQGKRSQDGARAEKDNIFDSEKHNFFLCS